MISRFTCVAFLALALSAHALPSRPQSEITVFRTVTPTAQPLLQTVNKGGVKPSPVPNAENRDKEKKPTKSGSESPKSTPAGGNGEKEKNGEKTGDKNGGNKGGNINNGEGNNNNKNNNNDPQKSQCLDPRVVSKGLENDGQDVPVAGQVRSLTTTNNFINYCLTVPNLPITNGKQVTTGSCNPVPIGEIPSVDRMPSSKFIFPKNFATIKAGQTFTIEMAITNMETGFFVNAQSNYFGAPQQLNKGGLIKGHSHVVVEKLDSLDQTRVTNPKNFAFFKGLNGAAQNGKLSTAVDKGLEPGVYRMTSINTSSNHQPVIAPVAQHGGIDDAVYFTVTADGKPPKRSK